MILNSLLNWFIGVSVISILTYVVSLRIKNSNLSRIVAKDEIKNETDQVKKTAYDTPINELIDESNKDIGDRIKRDRS